MQPPHGPLTAEDLFPRGPLGRLGRTVFIYDTLDSTNKSLLEQAATLGDGAVAYAEYQTAGRGRLGRRWLAPRGSSVLLSVLLLESADSPLLAQGALLASLAACEAIEAATDCSPTVRWPNDIMVAGRKVGGVLAESCSLPERSGRAVVIGAGINCLQQRGHFTDELARIATSLECESAEPVNRASVAAGLLARLDHWLRVAVEQPDGWTRVRSAWRVRCQDTGARVTLEHDGRTFTGTALDISEEGDLVVELDQGGRRAFAGTTTARV